MDELSRLLEIYARPGQAGKLADRVALITGGTAGIGLATALLFAREGARVALTGRRRDKGASAVAAIERLGGQAFYQPADHTLADDCAAVVQAVIDRWGRIDILFNNAGVVTTGTAEATSETSWSYTLALNVTAVWRMSRLALPHMRARGQGVIINNASDWAVVGGKEAVAYCASKGAVIQLTRAMALDHARENVRINALCPGDTYVQRWEEQGYFAGQTGLDREQALTETGRALPLGRVGRPEEIAATALFLASDDSSFMTGAVLLVDGGNTAG